MRSLSSPLPSQKSTSLPLSSRSLRSHALLGAAAGDVGRQCLVHERHDLAPVAVGRQDLERDEVVHELGVVAVGQVDQRCG